MILTYFCGAHPPCANYTSQVSEWKLLFVFSCPGGVAAGKEGGRDRVQCCRDRRGVQHHTCSDGGLPAWWLLWWYHRITDWMQTISSDQGGSQGHKSWWQTWRRKIGTGLQEMLQMVERWIDSLSLKSPDITLTSSNTHPSPGPLLKTIIAQRLAKDLDFYRWNCFFLLNQIVITLITLLNYLWKSDFESIFANLIKILLNA